MQLDQAAIAIRERSYGEILGLALQVCRLHVGWLAVLATLGVAPFAIVNYVLVGQLVSDVDFDHEPAGYWSALLYLVALEAPLAFAPVTLYLGQMTFSDRIRPRQIVVDLWHSLPQMLFLQGILRAITLPLLLWPYFRGPYLSELILLERNKFWAGKGQLSTLRRSRNLHTSSSGELFGQWLLALAAGGIMWAALGWGVTRGLHELFSIQVDRTMAHRVLWPLALWAVMAFFAVVRFLSYLDLRIRREGWEVELLMRAEAQRMRQAAAFG